MNSDARGATVMIIATKVRQARGFTLIELLVVLDCSI
jgi:competence protein ComGC